MNNAKKSHAALKEQFVDQEIWNKSLAELFVNRKSSQKGISSKQAKLRLKRYGLNSFGTDTSNLFFQVAFNQFKNPLLLMLLVCASLTAFIGEIASFLIILLIVSISTVIGVTQEYMASRQAELLKGSVALRSHVFRDGVITEVLTETIVPGDVVLLSAGDLVPGDGRILVAKDLFVDQSCITGESLPLAKRARGGPEHIQDLSDSYSTVFMGSAVISGTAEVLICGTGKNTFLGTIAQTLSKPRHLSVFLQDMNKYGLFIMRLTFLMVLVALTINLSLHRPWLESLLFSLALGVGMTPEFMPMIVSVCLARGARLMAKSKLVVKRISSIYDLGSMDVLCTDKTGTLTEGILDVVNYVNAQGYPNKRCFELAYLNSFFETGYKSPIDQAIMQHAAADTKPWIKIDELPFDFQHRRISVLLEREGKKLLILKGPLEDVLEVSSFIEESTPEASRPLNMQDRENIIRQFHELSEQGLRVLGISWQLKPLDYSEITSADEKELIFCGLLIFSDRPKESAKQALKDLQVSGIALNIITGDNELVTRNLCKQLDIPIKGILTCKQLQRMTDSELGIRIKDTNLFCRVTPDQKRRIVHLLKSQGNIVGFMGDGINDTPALHRADVSISVDNAVDVAKEAASFILLKKDLTVIHQGVIEGRKTFANIMKYTLMGTSANFGNMVSMVIASLLLPFLPMLPIQLLLNNLLYDIAGLGIPFDHVDSELLIRPSKWDISFINKFMGVLGPLSSLFDLGTFYILLFLFEGNQALFRTGWFIESLATQVLVIYIIRSKRLSLNSPPHYSLVIFSSIAVCVGVTLIYSSAGSFFGFVPMPPSFFMILLGIVSAYLLTAEFGKRVFFSRATTPSRLRAVL